MGKKSKDDREGFYISAAQLIGMALSVIIAFIILFTVEDAPMMLIILVLVGGMLGSAMLPLLIAEKLRDAKRARNRQQQNSLQRKQKEKPQQAYTKAFPHVLTEPVPDEPPDHIFHKRGILSVAEAALQWSPNCESITIQLLQKFKPEERLHAQKILQDLDNPMRPSMVIACLFLADGNLEELRGYVKLGNMDYRDLLVEFGRKARVE